MAASFLQLKEYFTPSSYTYDPYTPMYETNSGGIYEAKTFKNIRNKIGELSQKLVYLLKMRHSPTSPLHVCDICLSPNYLVSEYLTTYKSWEFLHEQTYQIQTQTTYYNFFSNMYNLYWKNYPNFLGISQPVIDYEPSYPEKTYIVYQYQNV